MVNFIKFHLNSMNKIEETHQNLKTLYECSCFALKVNCYRDFKAVIFNLFASPMQLRRSHVSVHDLNKGLPPTAIIHGNTLNLMNPKCGNAAPCGLAMTMLFF